jgi:hypothetical protein
MTRVTMIIFVALLLIMPAQAQPLPYPSGQCASDYVQSGSDCTPKNDRASAAIPKVGACPSGWAQSGSACQRMR